MGLNLKGLIGKAARWLVRQAEAEAEKELEKRFQESRRDTGMAQDAPTEPIPRQGRPPDLPPPPGGV